MYAEAQGQVLADRVAVSVCHAPMYVYKQSRLGVSVTW